MKKTLIALLALGSMAAIADTDFTIDSKLITSTVEQASAFDAIVNYSKTEAINNTGLGIDRVGKEEYQINIHLGDMFHSVELTTGQHYVVTTVIMGFRYDQQSSYMPTGTALTTTFNNVEYTTGEAAFVGTNGSTGTITWVFNTPIEMDGTEDITLNLTSETGKYGLTVGKNNGESQLVGVDSVIDVWKPIVRLSGTITPEPATATLSLLALAGLAARRRRH